MFLLGRVRTSLLEHAQWWLVGLGVLLRLKHLLENRPFWLDEAGAAVSISGRSFLEIIAHHEIMPEFARPPMLFMLIERFFISVFGNNEISLRAFPFICGVGALFVFWRLVARVLERHAALLALALFILLDPLVYYSAELKQYSTDLVCALILAFVSINFLRKELDVKKAVFVAVVGALVLWFSNAMVFVLPGIGGVFLWDRFSRQKRAEIFRFLAGAFFWLISFAVIYKLSLSQMVGNTDLKDTWPGAFRTGPLVSLETLQWVWRVLIRSLSNPVGIKWVVLSFPLCCWGAFNTFKKQRNIFFVLLTPIILTLLAAMAGKYPFAGRVILFLVPAYVIFISAGAADVFERIVKKGHRQIASFCLILLFAQPVVEATYNFFHARGIVDNRRMIDFFSEQYEPGDFVYLNTSGQQPFWYYTGQTKIAAFFPQPVVGAYEGRLFKGVKLAKFARFLGQEKGQKFVVFRNEYNVYDEHGMFRANMGLVNKENQGNLVFEGTLFPYPATGRTWVILSGEDPDDELMNKMIRASFDLRGKRLLSFEGKSARAYLYQIK